jgi:hypothetical protein
MPAGPQRQGGALPRGCPSVRMAGDQRHYARGGKAVKPIILAGTLALCLATATARSAPRENGPDPLSPSASANPGASTAPSAPVEPVQPAGPSTPAPAQPLAPSQPSALSPAAGAPAMVSAAAADSDLPEEVGQDQGAAAQTVPADLGKLDSATLARLARSLGVDAPTVWYDPDQQQPMTAASDNAQSVDAIALYNALQQRSEAGDKDARQALALARLRGDARAGAPAGPVSGTALAADSGTAAALGLQALSAAAQALGLSPSAAGTPAP